jgi:predicted kinase
LRVARAGKTTLATQLALERSAVRLTKDEWLWALGSTPWDRPAGEKIEQELWRLAQQILSLGLSVVLDFGLWVRVERDEMRTVARGLGVGVELHYLEVPTDELWRRIEVRNLAPPWDNQPIGHADLEEWLAIFQAPDPSERRCSTPRQIQAESLLPRPPRRADRFWRSAAGDLMSRSM